jgi:hypothetical protein
MLRPLTIVLPALIFLACQPRPGPGSTILATYDKSGGFVGFNQRLVVHESGALALDDKREHRLYETEVDPGTLERLRELLSSAEFQSAQRQYPQPDGADLITYTIEARAKGRTHTVTTMDTAAHPAAVQHAIAELDRLAQLARERGGQRAADR